MFQIGAAPSGAGSAAARLLVVPNTTGAFGVRTTGATATAFGALPTPRRPRLE